MTKTDRFYFVIILTISGCIQLCGLYFNTLIGWFFLTIIPFLWVHICCLIFSQKSNQKFLFFYKYTVILVGPFATTGCLLFLVFTTKRQLLREYREYMAVDVVFSASERLELGLTSDDWDTGKISISPYIDIMESDNAPMKRSTINRVVQHPGLYSRSILDTGLKDKDQDIRFYAASAMILLNDLFIKEFRELQEKIEQAPEDHKLHLKLATEYDRYCSWGLPEKEDYPSYYHKMEKTYQKSLDLSTGNEATITGLTRIQIEKGEMDKAEQTVTLGMKLYPESKNIIIQYLRVLFFNKDYKMLKKTIRESLENYSDIAFEFQEPVVYWDESIR